MARRLPERRSGAWRRRHSQPPYNRPLPDRTPIPFPAASPCPSRHPALRPHRLLPGNAGWAGPAWSWRWGWWAP
ncbi:MAG: hypothetical protein E2576_12450 [Alcaligenaceae bacterium]|nr:hypothetical protein [Alcaligenaceae bacterium SAGV5]MPS52461.1 hypothetical protein [Alcaligenaceae bacterium SAGV3]MPT57525.1 hypothetical protein [Alcaligenaceae bacterium]